MVPKANKQVLDTMWLHGVLGSIGEQFDDGEEICGIVVNVRPKQDRISVWTKTAANEALQVRGWGGGAGGGGCRGGGCMVGGSRCGRRGGHRKAQRRPAALGAGCDAWRRAGAEGMRMLLITWGARPSAHPCP